jgi:hypothetical protein
MKRQATEQEKIFVNLYPTMTLYLEYIKIHKPNKMQ